MFRAARDWLLARYWSSRVSALHNPQKLEPGLDTFRTGASRKRIESQLGKPLSGFHHSNGWQTDLYRDHSGQYNTDPYKMITIRSRYDFLRLYGNPILAVLTSDGVEVAHYFTGDEPSPSETDQLDKKRTQFLNMMKEYVPDWSTTVVKLIAGETCYLQSMMAFPGDQMTEVGSTFPLPAWRVSDNGLGPEPLVAITYGPTGHAVIITRNSPSGKDAPFPCLRVLDTIGVGEMPAGMAIAPDGRFVYVANHQSGTVSSLEVATGNVAEILRLPGQAHGIAISPDGSDIYATDFTSGTVVVIDASSKQVKATANVGPAPIRVAIAPDGRRAYVANFHADNLSVIDAATYTVTATVKVGAQPFGIAVTRDGGRVYVANAAAGTVSAIDAMTKRVRATIPVGERPTNIALVPDGRKAYVTNGESNTVSVIDTQANRVIDTFEVGNEPCGVQLSPDGSKLYVAYSSKAVVGVINTLDYRSIAVAHVGEDPQEIVLTRDGRRAYVSNAKSNTVSVLDLQEAVS
jgi:YVTN family beta-propeller protein